MRDPRFALLAVLLLAACRPAAPAPDAAVDTVRVALRVDDVFMHDTDVQPQEIDSFLAVAERHGAKVELAVIPQRLTAPRNADGRMAAQLAAYVRRGHYVSQHGWNHRHAPTGDTGSEFMDATTGAWISADTMRAQLGRGQRLLEQATGQRVDKYVSPGTDPQLAPENLRVLAALGFRWVTHDSLAAPLHTDSLAYVPSLTDYTWALSDSTYAATLAEAETDFRRARPNGYFSVGFHDHFTRYAWHDGLVARWLDDLLTWIEAQPGVVVEYVTPSDL